MTPLVEPLDPRLEPAEAFGRLAGGRHCIFFDSARRDHCLGRYSFLGCDPVDFVRVEVGDLRTMGDRSSPTNRLPILDQLQARLDGTPFERCEELPPFQGGLAGVLSYELGHALESIPRARFEEFPFPAVAIGLYDVVLAWDHLQNRSWIISQGWPETDEDRRRERAAARLAEILGRLASPRLARAGGPPEPSAEIVKARQFAVGDVGGLTSTFSAEGYYGAICRAKEYIAAGDIFQVNLAQRLLMPAGGDAVELYLRLRQCNPAPLAGYFDLGDFQVASASPERFLRVDGGLVETRPIKGTRPLSGDAERDEAIAAALQSSPKDRAENVMIVDLLRNDLGRVCQPGTIHVRQLCGLERYEHVVHLVSAVEGRLAPGRTPLDLVQAAFPGGSITGAPKIRAMEIIRELEPTTRGAYCGSLLYLGPDGRMDSNLLIRTITAHGGWWQAPVGGGIVADSVPEAEYRETWDKAKGLIEAMRPAAGTI